MFCTPVVSRYLGKFIQSSTVCIRCLGCYYFYICANPLLLSHPYSLSIAAWAVVLLVEASVVLQEQAYVVEQA